MKHWTREEREALIIAGKVIIGMSVLFILLHLTTL